MKKDERATYMPYEVLESLATVLVMARNDLELGERTTEPGDDNALKHVEEWFGKAAAH